MEEDKYIICIINVKAKSIPSNLHWREMKQAKKEMREQLTNDFYVVVNKIVSLGGALLLTKERLYSEETLISDFIKVMVPETAVDVLSQNDLIKSVQKLDEI